MLEGSGHRPLTQEVGGLEPRCSLEQVGTLRLFSGSTLELTKDSHLGISRPAREAKHMPHKGPPQACDHGRHCQLNPDGASSSLGAMLQAAPSEEAELAHEMGPVCHPSEPLTVALLPAQQALIRPRGRAATAAHIGWKEE